MPTNSLHNFHVPLPDDLYNKLRAEADRSKRPITELVRQAINLWLQQRHKADLHEAIAAYAARHAGTSDDLDQGLEEVSIEHLLDEEEKGS